MIDERKLKIKIGVVKRTTKEFDMYKEEVITETARYEALVSEKHARAGQQKAVLAESKGMVENTFLRLERGLVDLKKAIDEAKDDPVLTLSATYAEAVALVPETETKLAEEE
ncbi:Tubulin binding cofactor A like protein [Aduncisulcus paluster]|uniref:Tubulin-specific chaperone A n=1 Tax=Aduncisulcus paluster TaxID=2918883 RepID=A0ABQ5KRW9_9EUKA|nr:Tubulin binding cofactor A like protein [Aduncisulcus paluster]